MRVRQRASTNAKQVLPEKIFTIDPNEIDPIRGTSFAEQALAALQQHASQGPWPKSIAELLQMRRAEAGKLPLIRYRLFKKLRPLRRYQKTPPHHLPDCSFQRQRRLQLLRLRLKDAP